MATIVGVMGAPGTPVPWLEAALKEILRGTSRGRSTLWASSQRESDSPLGRDAPGSAVMDPPGLAATSRREEEEEEEPEMSVSLKSCFSQGLKQLHHTHELCNATLVAGGKRFPCNRALLASISPYFQAVFTSDFKESRDGEVLLRDMDSSILQNLLTYLYSGELALSSETAEDLFTVASRLQLTPALELISRYLTERISMESCLRLYMLAHDHNSPTLLRSTLRYLGFHFKPLLEHKDFPHLDLGALTCIISSDHLAVTSEMDVFQAVQQWVTAVPTERLSVLKTLLRHIRFPLLTHEEIAQVQADVMTLDQQVELQWEDLDGAGRLQVSGGLRQGMFQEKIICIKVPRLRDILSVNEDMDCYMECLDPATGSRTKLPPLELVALPGCSVLEHRLYISGGKHPDGSYSKALCEYNSLANRWIQLPPMSTPRSVHIFLTCKRKLFALSGWNDTGPLASAESFDVAKQTWSPIASLPIILRFSASASLKNKLYLIGGDADSDEVVYQGILVYDIYLDTWAQVPLEFSLHGAAAVTMQTGICVVGGFFSGKNTHSYPNSRFSQLLPCTSTCFFMHEAGVINKEVTIPPLPSPLAFAGATCFQGKVYVMGGVCTSKTHDAIYHWEPGEATWTQYPENLTGQGTIVRRVLKCVTLKVVKPNLRALIQDASASRVAIGLAETEVPFKERWKDNHPNCPPDGVPLTSLGAGTS
ncbi:kelch-like protein 6 [Rhineura floridana]|uniref:kelch-like protein 6 n=1 Tax=Rhineura floridana TaxID=261503 RepID=UPI002AC82D75|nr:kelch-like protein 6 [Rhineura floridana]